MSVADEIVKVLNSIDPIDKLIKTIGKGIGVVYEPKHIKKMAEANKKMAEAKAYELEVIGKAIREYPELQIEFKNGENSVNNADVNRMLDVTKNRLLFEECRKQQNIDNIVGNAYQELENTEEVLDTPVDQDWIYRFFDYAKGISNEEMQKAWGRILAGEVKSPGSFSLRTLDTIKNVSREEAQIFNKLSSFVFSVNKEGFIFNDTEILSKYQMTFDELMMLEDCGLINLNGFVTLDLKSQSNYLLFGDKVILIENEMSINIFSITQSGKEILKILNSNPNYDYMFEQLHRLEKTENYKIKVFNLKSNTKDEFDLEQDDLFEEYKKNNNIE